MTPFNSIREDIRIRLQSAPVVEATRWQSISAPQPMVELLNYSLTWSIPTEDLNWISDQVKPNLPWADRHFLEERVSGDPINPGETWKIWPYAQSANSHRKEGEQYHHSYAERYWPKAAGTTPDGRLESDHIKPHRGIRYDYGDLDDLVTILSREPTTRQAYLPVWFPEDLQAAKEEKRVPCSLGYHFIMRRGKLHVNYYLRSCDFVRHWADDVYLTVRLLLWVLDQCRLAHPEMGWDEVRPGCLTMHISSLHCFQSDLKVLS
jgi:thymidylate synthase